jgi:hypothetical protein
MIIQVDRRDNKVVQKVTKPDGTLVAYQSGIPGCEADMERFTTLTEARAAVGIYAKGVLANGGANG